MSLLRSRFQGVYSGTDQAMMTPVFETASPVLPSEHLDVIVDILIQWLPILNLLAGNQVPAWVWTIMSLHSIDGGTGDETFIGDGITNIVGNQVGQQLPTFTAAVMENLILGNPRNARLFVPALSEIDSNNQTISPGLAGTLNTAAFNWSLPWTGITSGHDFQPGLWSKKNLQFFDAIVGGLVPTLMSHQTRRKIGRGS